MTIIIDQDVKLESLSANHAEGLYLAVDSNREHLSEFLPWVNNMQSVNDFEHYIKYCELLHSEQKEVSFTVMYQNVVVGRIGLHNMNMQNNAASIGYWLTKDNVGKGIILKCCKALIDHGFKDLKLHRIEIKAATSNLKSQAIPEKLNFKKEGILREAELVNGNYFNLALYSLLRDEWPNK